MLSPKRTKFRKAHKGRIHGMSKGGTTLNFGAYGLKATSPERITARQIEAARRAIGWPLPLVGQYLPDLADALGRDTLAMRVDDVAVARIRRALAPYYAASATHEFKETV